MLKPWIIGLLLVLPLWGVSADATKYVELAGTVVQNQDSQWVVRSNGHLYNLIVEPSDPGVTQLRSGLAIIVKGTLTITDAGQDKERSLRPSVLIIRGRAFAFPS